MMGWFVACSEERPVEAGSLRQLAYSVDSDWERTELEGMTHVVAVDLEPDGWLDLLGPAADVPWDPSELSWYRGPTWFKGPLTGIGTAVTAIDVDQDGDLDPVFGRDDLLWAPNLGSGQFDAPLKLLADVFHYPVQFDASDLDADGDLDLVVADLGGVLRVEADGPSFGVPALVDGAGDYVGLADLDGDGLAEVVSTYAGAVFASANLGPAFGPPTVICDCGVSRVELVDFNHDGEVDLLTVDPTGLVQLHESSGPGTFAAPADLALTSPGSPMAAGDVDGDLDLDLVVAAGEYGLQVLANDDGVFTRPLTQLFVFGGWFTDCQLLDLDGDRAAEVVGTGGFDDWWTPFQASWVFHNPGYPDLDGDGLSDEAEVELGTDPGDPDSDGDGVLDYEDALGVGVVDSPTGTETTGGTTTPDDADSEPDESEPLDSGSETRVDTGAGPEVVSASGGGCASSPAGPFTAAVAVLALPWARTRRRTVSAGG
ncbi:MAG: FG-GAP-like repeat-containing protein [Myxococcota bacterium]